MKDFKMALPTVSIFGTINKIELKHAQAGKAICSYQIECSEKNAKGEWQNLYLKGVSLEKQAEFINQYFKDGDVCIATGKLVTENYTKKDGSKVYEVKIKFPQIQFAPKSKNAQEDQGTSQPKQSKPQAQNNYQGHDIPDIDITDVEDDEIPF